MGRLVWWLPNGYGSCEVLPNGTARVVAAEWDGSCGAAEWVRLV